MRWIDALSSHGGSEKGAAAAGASPRKAADSESTAKALSSTHASSRGDFSRTTSDEGFESLVTLGGANVAATHEQLAGRPPAVTTVRGSSTCVVL